MVVNVSYRGENPGQKRSLVIGNRNGGVKRHGVAYIRSKSGGVSCARSKHASILIRAVELLQAIEISLICDKLITGIVTLVIISLF